MCQPTYTGTYTYINIYIYIQYDVQKNEHHIII